MYIIHLLFLLITRLPHIGDNVKLLGIYISKRQIQEQILQKHIFLINKLVIRNFIIWHDKSWSKISFKVNVLLSFSFTCILVSLFICVYSGKSVFIYTNLSRGPDATTDMYWSYLFMRQKIPTNIQLCMSQPVQSNFTVCVYTRSRYYSSSIWGHH